MKNYLSVIGLSVLILLASCGSKSSGNSSTPYYGTYQQPQYGPPNYNWGNYETGYVPPGNCGQVAQLPSNCWGMYSGYHYCGNQWYYPFNNQYWIFPAFGSCGGGGHNDDWWDDYNYWDDDDSGDDDDSDDDGDDDGDNDSDGYSSGWIKMWNTMGSSESRYHIFTIPSDGTYYLSFSGAYSGSAQDDEKLNINFQNSNKHKIDDLDQSRHGGDIQKYCKVNVNFKLKGGSKYKVFLSGSQDSVNNTYIRLTSYWPGDISKLCD